MDRSQFAGKAGSYDNGMLSRTGRSRPAGERAWHRTRTNAPQAQWERSWQLSCIQCSYRRQRFNLTLPPRENGMQAQRLPRIAAWSAIAAAFGRLGLTSFGGPIAHLGYFRDEFVVRRRWLTDTSYAELVALCQFLPGPASSQVGFAIGLQRGGVIGGFIAWALFTLPSALMLLAFAYGAATLTEGWAHAALHGLKLVAVAVVAQAVWGMARTLCPDLFRAVLAVVAALLVAALPGVAGHLGAIVLGASAGLWGCRQLPLPADPGAALQSPLGRRAGLLLLLLFFLLLLGLPLVAERWSPAGLFDVFYRAGALVFGGGHVLLPLLEPSVVGRGWLSEDQFLAGYGAAQAIPGPLFTFAAYVGALVTPGPSGVAGAAIALLAVSLPGLLLVLGVLPFWAVLRRRRTARAAMAGANAAVVGILAAALCDPVWTSAVHSLADLAIVLVAFLLLVVWRQPPWRVVLLTVLAAMSLTWLG